MASHPHITILILAAGASSRMGQPKQLLPWKDTSLLGHAIQMATASHATSVKVVLGAHADSIAQSVRKEILGDVEIVENTSWQSGLGSSIACGTQVLLMEASTTNGIMITLADQPLIDTDYLNSMIAIFSRKQKGIIATAYKNRTGVPALFAASYFEELTKLDDDFGAKKIIESHQEDVLVLDPANKTVDIDTKSEYTDIINSIDKYL